MENLAQYVYGGSTDQRTEILKRLPADKVVEIANLTSQYRGNKFHCFWTMKCPSMELSSLGPLAYIQSEPNPPPVFISDFLAGVLRNDSPDQIPQFPLATYPANYVASALTNLTSTELTKVLSNLPQYQLTQVLNDLGDKKNTILNKIHSDQRMAILKRLPA